MELTNLTLFILYNSVIPLKEIHQGEANTYVYEGQYIYMRTIHVHEVYMYMMYMYIHHIYVMYTYTCICVCVYIYMINIHVYDVAVAAKHLTVHQKENKQISKLDYKPI